MIFFRLCLDELRKGNRPGTHFNKAGYTNLINSLQELTGKTFTQKQLKNHWDNTKKDWKLYDHLIRTESGLGWDPVNKSIDATKEWWDAKIQVMILIIYTRLCF